MSADKVKDITSLNPWKRGALVCLRSGSPIMTVDTLHHNDKSKLPDGWNPPVGYVQCTWFGPGFLRSFFHVDTLCDATSPEGREAMRKWKRFYTAPASSKRRR